MSETKVTGDLWISFKNYLKNSGLKETYERRIIGEILSEHSGHFDLNWLADELRNKGAGVSRATLYNTINLLMKAELVRRSQFADGTFIYECTAKLPSGNQLHVVCTSCGKVSDIRNAATLKTLMSLKFGKFVPSYMSLTIYGTCSRCATVKRKLANAQTSQLKLFKTR